MRSFHSYLVRIAFGLIGLVLITVGLRAETYTLRYIDNTNIEDINEQGEVVAGGSSSAGYALFLPVPAYGLPAGRNPLRGIDGSNQRNVNGLNDLGVCVGTSKGSDGAWHLVTWTSGVIAVLGGSDTSWTRGFDINNRGHIIGQTSRFSPPETFKTQFAFFWDGSQFLKLVGYNSENCANILGEPYAINNSDAIVGVWACALEGNPNYVGDRYLWQGDSPTKIDVPGMWTVKDINDHGVMLITMESMDLGILEGGSVTVLPRIMDTPGGQDWAFMNDLGEAVGTALVGGGPGVPGSPRSFLWLPAEAYGLPAGLNDLTDVLAWQDRRVSRVFGINNSGQIACRIIDTIRNRAYAYVLTPTPPPAPGFVVNSTADDIDSDHGDGTCATSGGECTLRAALEEANALAGPDTISFNLPGSRVPLIQPDSALPVITDEVVINGLSQPRTGKVELDGGRILSGVVDGLRISAGGSKLAGLLINGFTGNGLSLTTGDGNVVDEVCIGVGPEGIDPRGNARHGIIISNSSANQIGSDVGNIIAFNGSSGVFVESGEGNTIQGNSIFSNSGLAIDLAPSGVNPNDTLDVDAGANTLVNTPVIDSFAAVPATDSSLLKGHIQGAAGAVYTVDIFAGGSCHPSGVGDGQTFLGNVAATANGDGRASFEITVNHRLGSTEIFAATATDAAGNTSEFSPCVGLIHLEIVDVDSLPLANLEFVLSSVAFDPPNYTETPLDTCLTDSEGIISLPADRIKVGDSLKVYRYLGSVPAVRHPALLSTMYSVHLDNAKIDSLGEITYDEINAVDTQRIVMDHSTFAYNMLISIEWDAEPGYLDAWQPCMRRAANHLYDVSDGQMTIDTVVILDSAVGWDEADVQVHANNVLWPANLGNVGTIFTRPGSGGPFVFPRTGYGSKDVARELTVTFDPIHFLAAEHYITLLHEFFHYAFALWDEYKNRFNVYEIEWTRCDDRQDQFNRYGVMDLHLDGQPYSSEFSSIFRYPSGCRNNRQWWVYGMSCWDHLDTLLAKTYSGVKAPLIRPDERPRKTGLGYIPGPNDNAHIGDASDMDYDVGRFVVFPVVHEPTAAGSYLVVVTTNGAGNVLARKAKVRLLRNSDRANGRTISQGQTSDRGELLALGVSTGDFLYSTSGNLRSAAGPLTSTWSSGGITIGPNNSPGGGSASSSPGNALTIVMDTVAGYFPLVP